jgi:dihydrodipicolinate synthase/N-acetylneuraminate lyase
METHPFIASVKHVLRRRGVPINSDLRAPMRALTEPEGAALDSVLGELDPAVSLEG